MIEKGNITENCDIAFLFKVFAKLFSKSLINRTHYAAFCKMLFLELGIFSMKIP
jgi:hypothetical protein